MKQVLTTGGLSIFTNYLRQNNDIKDKYDDLNTPNMTADKWDQNKKSIDSIRKSVIEWAKDKKDASAEIKSLIKLSNNYNQAPLDIYFIATDTILSKLAAEIIESTLKIQYQNWVFKPIKVIDGLNVYSNDLKSIHTGYQELIKYLNSVTFHGVIYNISGGYKAIIPIMTLIASLKKVNLCYIYEDSNKLIEIPPFPFEFDIKICNQFEDLLNNLEKNTFISIKDYEGYETKISSDKQKSSILKSLILKEADQVSFSEIGFIIWEEWKNQQPIHLFETTLKPEQKKISIRDDHGKDKLTEFAKKLVNSVYVIEVINSLPFNSKDTSFIKNISYDGKIELVLHKTDKGLGLVVQTTGRTKRETDKIAKILEKEYYA